MGLQDLIVLLDIMVLLDELAIRRVFWQRRWIRTV